MREKERRKKTKIDSAVITSKTKDKKVEENPRKSIGLSFIFFVLLCTYTKDKGRHDEREKQYTS